jgi:hypothetical protein
VTVPRRRAAGPVRITLPARVADRPEVVKTSSARVAEPMGHPRCFSGADGLVQMARTFVGHPAGKAVAADPEPAPWRALGPQPEPGRVTVGRSSGVKENVDKVLTAVDQVLDRLGPHPCLSGVDVLRRDARDRIGVHAQLSFHLTPDCCTGIVLPPRPTEAGLACAGEAAQRLRNQRGVPLAGETGVNARRPRRDAVPDGEFRAALAERADCGRRLDRYHVAGNERNGRPTVAPCLA